MKEKLSSILEAARAELENAADLKAMEDLPELMSRMGKMDYDAFCRSVMLDAAQYLRGERTGDRSIHFHE